MQINYVHAHQVQCGYALLKSKDLKNRNYTIIIFNEEGWCCWIIDKIRILHIVVMKE